MPNIAVIDRGEDLHVVTIGSDVDHIVVFGVAGPAGIQGVPGGFVFPASAPDGSCAAPSYSFANAPASGVFFDGTAVVISDDNCTDFIEVGASVNVNTATGFVRLRAGYTAPGTNTGVIIETDNVERLRIGSNGAWNLHQSGGGLVGQAIVSKGSSENPDWSHPEGLLSTNDIHTFTLSTVGNLVLDSDVGIIGTALVSGGGGAPTVWGHPKAIASTAGGFDIALDTFGALNIDGDPGTAGQAITSAGPGAPAAWGAGGTTFPLAAPDGSCAAPSYSFASDAAGGMWFDPGAGPSGSVVISDHNCTNRIDVGASILLTTATDGTEAGIVVTLSSGASGSAGGGVQFNCGDAAGLASGGSFGVQAGDGVGTGDGGVITATAGNANTAGAGGAIVLTAGAFASIGHTGPQILLAGASSTSGGPASMTAGVTADATLLGPDASLRGGSNGSTVGAFYATGSRTTGVAGVPGRAVSQGGDGAGGIGAILLAGGAVPTGVEGDFGVGGYAIIAAGSGPIGGDIIFHTQLTAYDRETQGNQTGFTATERFRIIGDSGAWSLDFDPGVAGQVITSGGSSAPPTWEDASSPELYAENPVAHTPPVASGDNAVVIGSGAFSGAGASNALVLGTSASAGAAATDSIVIGNAAVIATGGGAMPVSAIVIGQQAQALLGANASIAIGFTAAVSGADSIAIGDAAATGGSAARAIAIGFSAFAGVSEAIAIGDDAGAGSAGAIAIGNGAVANTSGGTAGIAIGNAATVGNATEAIAIGDVASATATGSVAIGDAATIHTSATGAIAIGDGANTDNAAALRAVALGAGATATALEAVAIGDAASATHSNSIALGNGATTTAANQIVLGDASVTEIVPGADDAVNLGSAALTFFLLFARGLILPGTNKAFADTPYAVVATDFAIFVDTSGGATTVTLPASPTNGRLINVKKITTDGNNIIVDGNGKTLDGAASVTSAAVNKPNLQLLYDSSANDWRIL